MAVSDQAGLFCLEVVLWACLVSLGCLKRLPLYVFERPGLIRVERV